MNHERSPQKTIPHAGYGTRKARNSPDAPPIPMQPLIGFAIEFPGQKPPTNGNGTFEVKTVFKDVEHEKTERRRRITVVQLTPKVRQPLTPLFKNAIDGHKVAGGGGTSKEALRRAKRKKRNLPQKTAS